MIHDFFDYNNLEFFPHNFIISDIQNFLVKLRCDNILNFFASDIWREKLNFQIFHDSMSVSGSVSLMGTSSLTMLVTATKALTKACS